MPPKDKFSKGDEVWARLKSDADPPFVAAKVVETTVDGAVVEVAATSEKHALPTSSVFRSNPGGGDVPDLTGLLALNEATMLDALRQRYAAAAPSIYTFAAEMLICLNPYAPLAALYTDERRQGAKAADLKVGWPRCRERRPRHGATLRLPRCKALSAGCGMHAMRAAGTS